MYIIIALIKFDNILSPTLFFVFIMRLMGKREIGQLQPFELAISIMIADLASIPMSDVGIPILNIYFIFVNTTIMKPI